MIIDCAHYQDGRRRDEGPVPLAEAAARCTEGHLDGFAAFAAGGIGGLVVPLALLFTWLRFRTPHARTAAAPDGN